MTGERGSIWPAAFVLTCTFATIIAIAALVRAQSDVVDDAYITFRYVQNLLAGNGLVYNVGERVEGFSNPLTILLLLLPGAVGIPLEIASRAMGMMAIAIAALATVMTLRRLGAAGRIQALGGCCVVACMPLLYYSLTGLETGTMAALIALGLWRWYVAGERVDALGALVWAGVTLSRPEGVLYPFALGVLHLTRAETRTPRSLLWPVAVGVFVLLTVLARHSYYGLWLPNTFYAKPPGTAALNPDRIGSLAAFRYLGEFCLRSGLVLPALAIAGAAAALKESTWRAPAVLTMAGVVFGLYAGGDWFPAGRYFLPIVPVAAVLAMLGAGRTEALAKASAEQWSIAGVFALSVGSLVTLTTFVERRTLPPYNVMSAQDCVKAADWMKANLPADTRIVAFRIGALGYRTEFHVIDLFGLVDHEMALKVGAHPELHPSRELGSNIPGVPEYIAAQKPTALLAVNHVGLADPPVLKLYGITFRLVRSFPQGSKENWLLYLAEGNS